MLTERGQDRDSTKDPLQYERFVQLYARVRENLFAYIFTLLPHWSDAEDVFQQTSLVLWRKFGEFQPETNFLGWACRVAFFEVRNFQRVAGRDRLRFSDAVLAELAQQRVVSPEDANLKREFLLDCIAKLTDDQRVLLLRTYDDEKTIRQLADEFDRAPQTLYNRLNRIRRTLFECVEAAMQRQEMKQQT
ncbi:MAG: sigma-70 family RNA polymerase sigma factor [Thermoguttaceae bacterium]